VEASKKVGRFLYPSIVGKTLRMQPPKRKGLKVRLQERITNPNPNPNPNWLKVKLQEKIKKIKVRSR